MRLGHRVAAAVVALVSLVSVQTASFAGMASKGFYGGKVRYFGNKNFKIKQPAPPVQAAANVNVRDFGATGNGVTDDTGAIQSAIATAKATGQGVLFPAGTYLHADVITANGVALVGVGGSSVLLANNPGASAVILTGVSPSIQNIVISSVPAGSGILFFQEPNRTTLAVRDAQNFVVSGITVIQGPGRPGVYLRQSAIGQVSGVTFNGGGTGLDYGVLVDGCSNVSLIGNLFLNEGIGIQLGGISGSVSQSIAVISNTINGTLSGIFSPGPINSLSIGQNQIQMLGSGSAIAVSNCNNFFVLSNSTFNGSVGLTAMLSAGQSGTVSQNVIRNPSGAGASIQTSGAGANVQFTANQFGECGLTSPSAAIAVFPNGGADTVVLLNNVYHGHGNMLTHFIASSAHINVVSGNAQTQAVLPNNLP